MFILDCKYNKKQITVIKKSHCSVSRGGSGAAAGQDSGAPVGPASRGAATAAADAAATVIVYS